jgi:primase-polymerase (primpol)-like protein
MFIVWRGSDKAPIDALHPLPQSSGKGGATINAQDPSTWLTYEVAAEYARTLGAGYGVGIVLHEGCGLLCVDIDGCIEPSGMSPLAVRLIREARAHCPDCYVEISMSGRGVHIIGPFSGKPPTHSTKNKEIHTELYTSGRYIALTGVPCPPI